MVQGGKNREVALGPSFRLLISLVLFTTHVNCQLAWSTIQVDSESECAKLIEF